MNTTHRSYSESLGDFDRLVRFVVANNRAVRRYSTWCLGRLVDWRYNIWPAKRPIERFCAENAELWFDGFGDLAGFTISENGRPEAAIITSAGHRVLFAELLLWAVQAWSGRGAGFSIEITADQALEIQALEAAGFRRQATFYTQWLDLTRPLPSRYPLEPGFTIVDMATQPNYRAQRTLRADAFNGISDPSDPAINDALEWQSFYHLGPTYHAPTDLCVMAEDGSYVAGCEALIDARNVEADIERVCTHSAYRRRGLARAVIQECLYRLQAMGIERAAITGYSEGAMALYASMGDSHEVVNYIYELRPAEGE
jgi:GNAT superfamily N-acetyltransferase